MSSEKREKKQLDWKELGQFLNRLLQLFTIIRDTFTEMEIGLDLIGWLIGDGKPKFIKWLKSLGQKFLVVQQLSITTSSSTPGNKTFTVLVDYDDPEHYREINPNDYYFVRSGLRREEHYPIDRKFSGLVKRIFEYLKFDNDDDERNTRKILDEIKHRGLRRPDFAETRDFLKAFPDEQNDASIISFCGTIFNQLGDDLVAIVTADKEGKWLESDHLKRRWQIQCRFLTVHK